ncbi:MAG: gluconolactonase [Acidobacteria bacterium]|nr:MAG: gluconolactonase [Acidobacteriota bacterium]
MNCKLLMIIVLALSFDATFGQISKFKTIGTIERRDPALDNIIAPNTKVEVIAEGFDWSEGPVWINSQKMLLFSDIPQNIIYKWTEERGKEVYLTPSGYTDSIKRSGEMGSNGLLLDARGNLVLCQHGNRQMARMNASLNAPKPLFITLASNYKGKRFNSPNDAVYNSRRELLFTDPPYGLEKQMNDPKKELSFQGVYKLKTNGEVILLVDSLTRPNGIAFMPGEKTLIVSNSDPAKPFWYAFEVKNDALTNCRIFYSAAGYDSTEKGLPDGLKIDTKGNVFATGPGGVWIFNKEGKLLGKIKLTDATSNCAFSPDQKTLYVTNDMNVLRIRLK